MISSADLRAILDYNPQSGLFTWAKKTGAKVVVGRNAGAINKAGYRVIGIGGRVYYAHRLAWLYMTAEMPNLIDHVDGDVTNNAWANLRAATSTQNVFNAKRATSNSSGFKGVSWHKAAGRWAAHYNLRGRKYHLGLFDDPEEAHAAYLAAVMKAEPNFVRGS